MKLRIKKSTTFVSLCLSALVVLGLSTFLVFSTNNVEAQGEGGRLITVHDRGAETVFVTAKGTLKEALVDHGYALDEKDAVEPSLDEKLIAPDYQVNIYRARPVTIVDGPTRQKIVTPYQSAERIVKDAGIELYAEDETKLTRSTDFVRDGAGLQLAIDRATPFVADLYGKKTELRTQAATVGEMLKEKGITLSESDRVSLPQETPITQGMELRIWREGKQTVTVEEELNFETEKVEDADRTVGYKAVQTPGQKGTQSVTYEVYVENGAEVKRVKLQSVVLVPAVKQVEVVGIKSNYSSSLQEWLLALRTCETGGRYNANTGNGYYGAYQFMVGTWNSIAPKAGLPHLVGVRPDMASPAEQDAMVVKNAKLSKGGLATQHPGCYKKLGLSAFPPE